MPQKFLSQLDAHIAKNKQETVTPKDGQKVEPKSRQKKVEAATKAEEPQQENVLDFVNEIKAQAYVNTYEQAGFIYEPTSGLYYDTKSKYYYNPQYDLYYNGNDGNWYRLNPRTHEFIFHSGTEASQAAKKVEYNELNCLLAC